MILEPSYTWSDAYILPYESLWSLKVKFCFLNGMNWSRFTQKLLLNASNASGFNKSNPLFNERIKGDLLINESFTRICPKCMKYGYHSNMHQSMLYKHCFLHPDTVLVTLSEEEIKAAKQGTYGFTDIKTENLVNNNSLKNEIIRFQKAQSNIVQLWTFCHPERKDGCLNSTVDVVENSCLGRSESNTNNHRIIVNASIEDIFELNKEIYNDMIDTLIKRYYKIRIYESIQKCRQSVRNYMELPDKENGFIFNGLGSVFYLEAFVYSKLVEMNIDSRRMSDIIEIILSPKPFDNENYAADISLIASSMTLSSMIDADDARDYSRLHGFWHMFGSPCNYATPLMGKLDGLHFYGYANDKYLQDGMLFFVKEIYNDFYEYTRKRLILDLVSGKFNGLSLNRITNDMIKEPEYVVIRYHDRWIVYACYDEQ